jgi:hypothetical protein
MYDDYNSIGFINRNWFIHFEDGIMYRVIFQNKTRSKLTLFLNDAKQLARQSEMDYYIIDVVLNQVCYSIEDDILDTMLTH